MTISFITANFAQMHSFLTKEEQAKTEVTSKGFMAASYAAEHQSKLMQYCLRGVLQEISNPKGYDKEERFCERRHLRTHFYTKSVEIDGRIAASDVCEAIREFFTKHRMETALNKVFDLHGRIIVYLNIKPEEISLKIRACIAPASIRINQIAARAALFKKIKIAKRAILVGLVGLAIIGLKRVWV